MIDHRFALLGALIPVLGTGGYALDTIRGRTQPNRVSWAMWALAPLIAFAAQVSEHVGLSSLMTFTVGAGPVAVTIASFHDARAYWRLTRFDAACGVLSLAALVMWALTGQGNVAIAFSILADLLAGVPTLYKGLRFPRSESPKAFVGGTLGSAVTLLALPLSRWGFATAGFAAHIFLFDLAMSGLILAPRRVTRQDVGEPAPATKDAAG